uniref:Uncharacterized protein n=1 Tax=Anguilla anguilla TaxID=7936 RepID=A0A0E9SP86_ANGAN
MRAVRQTSVCAKREVGGVCQQIQMLGDKVLP